jgi:hypothetical protein
MKVNQSTFLCNGLGAFYNGMDTPTAYSLQKLLLTPTLCTIKQSKISSAFEYDWNS